MIASTPQTRKIASLLPDAGLSRGEFLDRLRARFPRHPASRLSLLVEQAITAGDIEEVAGALYRAGNGPAPHPTSRSAEVNRPAPPPARPLRVVAIDVESVVRTTDREPYTERRIFQIGAVRCGADRAWTSEADRFTRWLALPLGDDWTILSDRMREQHADEAVPAAEALADLLTFLEGVDAVVAYNGTDADFPMLAQALAAENLPGLPGTHVDGYYLALSLWPAASSHRLATLAEDLEVDRWGLSWHDATDDAELLGRLLETGARAMSRWPADLVDLVASVCPDSTAWLLLREMAGDGDLIGTHRTLSHSEVADIAVGLLTGREPRRGTSSGEHRPLLADDTLRGPDGRIDPVALAASVHGDHTRRRPAQEQMATALNAWANTGVGGVVEAPTGTGKSYAILAAAIDWLAADPAHTVIVTTFTKQLQAQLADDLVKLEPTVPGLLGLSDVVKGKANRLSLRALVLALSDATTLDSGRRARPGISGRFLPDPRYRELLVYLLLRSRATTGEFTSWASRSVDPVDIPMFFAEYAGQVVRAWLAALSQGEAGDYVANSENPISLYTDTVVEALAGQRLVLANHALLLAHLDQLENLGANAILVVDEAHEMENAATSALTTSLDYPALEDLCAELESWTREMAPDPHRAGVGAAVANLISLLDHENLPKLASQIFDSHAPGTAVGSRTVSLASPFPGAVGRGRVGTLAGLLTRLAGLCEGTSTLIVDTVCYAAAASVFDLVSYSAGLRWPRAEWRRRVL